MHSQQPPGVVQNWSTMQCSKQNTEQCGYDHAPVTRGRMRAQFPLPHGQERNAHLNKYRRQWPLSASLRQNPDTSDVFYVLGGALVRQAHARHLF